MIIINNDQKYFHEMNSREALAMRYIVVDRAAGETLCLTPDPEEACAVWQEQVGYSAEVHAVPARARAVFLGRHTRDAGMRAMETVRGRIGVSFPGMPGTG